MTDHLIIKLEGIKGPFYMEWSKVVDAPVTYGMNLDEFTEFYMEEYGKSSMQDLTKRLTRVEERGCSSLVLELDDILENNRAGENETKLNKEEIYRRFCLEKSD